MPQNERLLRAHYCQIGVERFGQLSQVRYVACIRGNALGVLRDSAVPGGAPDFPKQTGFAATSRQARARGLPPPITSIFMVLATDNSGGRAAVNRLACCVRLASPAN